MRRSRGTTATAPSVLLVSSSGGHLAQLRLLEPWWSGLDRSWVTFDGADAEALLAGETTYWAHHPTTRNIPNLFRNLLLSLRVIWRERPGIIVSNGAGVALPFFYIGRLLGARTVFIEVYDRIDSASLTGRLCRPVTSLLLLQWEEQRRVRPRRGHRSPLLMAGEPLIVVSTGTDKRFPFDRLIAWVEAWEDRHPGQAEFCVQWGISRPSRLPGAAQYDGDALDELLRRAHAVVVQGGPGGIMRSRQHGIKPIVVPRAGRLGEVADDHQITFATWAAQRDLVVHAATSAELDSALDQVLLDPSCYHVPPEEPATEATVARFSERVERLWRTGR